MKLWVVTGPIGAGKSLVSALLGERGAVLVDADAVGHQVLEEPDIRDSLVHAFGPVLGPDCGIDRSVLAARVFNDPGDLSRLNELVHPRLAERLRERLLEVEAGQAGRQPDLAVLEAAVYFQLPQVEKPDLVITVTAGEAVRMQRLVDSGRFSVDSARSRIVAQRPALPLYFGADVILINEGCREDLERDIDALIARHLDIPQLGDEGRGRLS